MFIKGLSREQTNIEKANFSNETRIMERDDDMSEVLANDVRLQYQKTFTTIRRIVETFPEDQWLQPHGDEYYLPCRIAYHLAVVIDNYVAGGYKDKDFASKLPYGKWSEATAEILPNKAEFMVYFSAVLGRADRALATLNDEILLSPLEPERTWMGGTQMALHLYMMRELSDHTGELNKMLIENGLSDVWVGK